MKRIMTRLEHHCLPAVALCWLLLSPMVSGAQEADAAPPDRIGEEEDYDNSQHVDESEENYRARMELRDQRYRDTPRMNTTYAPSTASEIIDGLPLASQEHIKAQLRDMIIESRQWEPGEDLTDFPYEPSAEAQGNAALRNKEREAWVEQLQKFQEREAAAYADAEEGQKGSSSQGGAAEPPASTAGVSESALSFLRGAEGPGGPLEEGNGLKGAMSDGDQGPDGENEEQVAAAMDMGTGSQAGEETGAEQAGSPAPMPGTLELGELAMLQGLNGQPGGTSLTGSGSQGASGQSQSGQNRMPQPGFGGDASQNDQGAQMNPASQTTQQQSVQIASVDNALAAASRETQTQEPTEIIREVVIEPGTIDIAELRLLDGN